jgi:hypothetical protein
MKGGVRRLGARVGLAVLLLLGCTRAKRRAAPARAALTGLSTIATGASAAEWSDPDTFELIPCRDSQHQGAISASTFLNSRDQFLLVLKADPDPAAIVTATIMIIPKMSVTAIPTLMEIPVVRMVVESHTRDGNPCICMPAVTVTVTGNIGGRRGGPKDGAPTDNSR